MSFQVVDLEQGSQEWLDFRLTKRPASETPAVLGISPYMSARNLFLVRSGIKKVYVHKAMQRGHDLEAFARGLFCKQIGMVFTPLVAVSGEYMASLDGHLYAGSRSIVLEIKCPADGKGGGLWEFVETRNAPPPHHMMQVQHQLMVTGADMAYFVVYGGGEVIFCVVEPDAKSFEEIERGWEAFEAADFSPRHDETWCCAEDAYLEALAASKEADAALEAARARLIDLAQGSTTEGTRLKLTVTARAGSVEYSNIPELSGVNLDAYRKPATTTTTIAVKKRA